MTHKKTTGYNTRFILFGHSAPAFAKAVAPAKDNYFCFANVQKAVSFVSNISVETVSKRPKQTAKTL